MLKKLAGILLAAGIFLSCGLEDTPHLDQPGEWRVTIRPDGVDLNLQGIPDFAGGHARNYAIFYRLYISDHLTLSVQTSPAVLSLINPALNADFSFFAPFTNPTVTVNTAGLGTVFTNRSFFELYVNTGAGIQNISTLLGTGFTGGTLQINFPQGHGDVPHLIMGGANLPLLRSTGVGTFSPLPVGRLFQNHPELNDNSSAGAASHINRDTATNAAAPTAAQRWVYISLYILVRGLDNNTFATIFSQPTHLGIFLLPEAN
ncbi:MAG: hypothetical protein FWG66_09085 [Spirochaetes bacterium]|nr:hypothetical protein [Spirochaetota bacterium]